MSVIPLTENEINDFLYEIFSENNCERKSENIGESGGAENNNENNIKDGGLKMETCTENDKRNKERNIKNTIAGNNNENSSAFINANYLSPNRTDNENYKDNYDCMNKIEKNLPILKLIENIHNKENNLI